MVLHKMIGTGEVLATLLLDIRKKHPFKQIVDLGSGSGGVMPETVRFLNDKNPESPVTLLLTDLHPNTGFRAYINDKQDDHVHYAPEPMDALQLSEAPKGLKTMIASFHHMPPEKARKILKSAQDNQEPLLIYEIAKNNISLLVWWILLSISLAVLFTMSLFMTPFSRPFTLKQIVFTYLIPIIPICYAWDGQASLPRTYTFDDIGELLSDIKTEDYTWKIDKGMKPDGRSLRYYLLGLPERKDK